MRPKILELKSTFAEIPLERNKALREEDVKQQIIERILKILGWEIIREQPTDTLTTRTVDYGLFIDKSSIESAKSMANETGEEIDRLDFTSTILEAKKFQVNLGKQTGKDEDDKSAISPDLQIRSYLKDVSTFNESIGWGILTNGRIWRLYCRHAYSRGEKYLEIDLWGALGLVESDQKELSFKPDSSLTDGDYVLALFALFFSSRAFEEYKGASSFLNFALGESRRWQLEITEDLSAQILNETYRELIEKISAAAGSKEINGETLQATALTFLFRLLFILYAEDRKLLPIHEPSYKKHSLRRIRVQIHKNPHIKTKDSKHQFNYWTQFNKLCNLIDKGSGSLGIPPYNGGLFDKKRAPLLNDIQLDNCAFAIIMDEVARTQAIGVHGKTWINFYDLNASNLGAIYEQLSQYEVEIHPNYERRKTGPKWQAVPNKNLRNEAGVYYTPNDLVQLVLDRTLEPLAKECEGEDKADPAAELLELKVVDPAMGSGHFLVGATDWLTDRIERAIGESDKKGNPSSILTEIENLRQEIMANAKDSNWIVDEDEHLSDSNLIRRMVLKRCIHGVDKSYYAVEIAKLSLWLHSFTVGAPLSYLDHHIQHGDSLFGESVEQVLNLFRKNPSLGPLLLQDLDKVLANAVEQMTEIEGTIDTDIESVKYSEAVHRRMLDGIRGYIDTFSFLHALRWQYPNFWVISKRGGRKKQNTQEAIDLDKIRHWMRTEGDKLPEAIEAREIPKELKNILPPIYELMREENFFHWQLAFPHIWTDTRNGFDAVISNPPWERVRMETVEWFAIRNKAIAKVGNQATRKKKIAELKRNDDPLYKGYEQAVARHKDTARVVREGGYYPLLARGDLNYYTLFVERAQALIKPEGMAGMVTPSGLATDKPYSEFFEKISAGGRIACLFDFENKKIFFPDVHPQFRFLIAAIGGEKRTFEETQCAFFLRSVSDINEGKEDTARRFTLGADDFALVNPNTGTVPLFRSKKDAELVLDVYERLPVLHNLNEVSPIYPVRYYQMFHMSGDSGLFRTEKELIEQGFDRVKGKSLLRAEKTDYVPLYQGRMIHQFDHRAATVKINPENPLNQYYTDSTTEQEHANPDFLPTPHNWVPKKEVEEKLEKGGGGNPIGYFLGFRDITNATNERTMISAIVPRVGFGNTSPLLLPEEGKESEYKACLLLLCANFNSFAFDYIARCKLQGTHMTRFLIEQLPVVPLKLFQGTKIGGRTVRDLVWSDSFRLTYTAHDLDALARDQGYKGKPFKWHKEERIQLRARLDALFFMLYSFDNEDALTHILDSFGVIGKRNETARDAHARNCRLIRDYIAAFKDGNPNPWLSDALPYPDTDD